jgi:hypothetical protein
MEIFKNELYNNIEKFNAVNINLQKKLKLHTCSIKDVINYKKKIFEQEKEICLNKEFRSYVRANYFIEENKNKIIAIETQLRGYEDCDGVMSSEFALLIILTTLLDKHENVTREDVKKLIHNRNFNEFLLLTSGCMFKEDVTSLNGYTFKREQSIFNFLQKFQEKYINEPEVNCQICEYIKPCRITECYKRICGDCVFKIKHFKKIYKCPFCKNCDNFYYNICKYYKDENKHSKWEYDENPLLGLEHVNFYTMPEGDIFVQNEMQNENRIDPLEIIESIRNNGVNPTTFNRETLLIVADTLIGPMGPWQNQNPRLMNDYSLVCFILHMIF